MSKSLASYPDYKPAGLPWLDRVPAHWEQVSIRAITEIRNARNRPDLQLLSVYREYGVIPKSSRDDNHNADGADLAAYKVVEPGFLVLNKMKTWQGSLGISAHHGIVSPAYIVCEVTRKDIDKRYLNLLFRSRPYINVYNSISFGVRVGQWDMRYDDFKQIQVLLPPLLEQQHIVAFLDAKGRQIARLIRYKRQFIKLLNEQRQALIYRAVTKGLEATAPRKDSGVAWLGEVPSHWNVLKVKFLAHVKTGGRDTENKVNDGAYPFFVRSQTIERINSYSFDGEAVLTAGDGAGVGKVFHYFNGKFDYHQRVYKFSRFKQVSGKFFFYYLKINLQFEALDASAKSTVDSLRLPLLQNFPITVPPSEEQERIVTYIETEERLIEQTISRAQSEIKLIQEYRIRLISDVVTGRVDVRYLVDTVGEILLPDGIELEDEEDENEEELAEAEAAGE